MRPRDAKVEPPADERARRTEAQMTDDERFSLLISVIGARTDSPDRDERIPSKGRR